MGTMGGGWSYGRERGGKHSSSGISWTLSFLTQLIVVCLLCSVIIHGVHQAVSRSIADYTSEVMGTSRPSSFSYTDQPLARLPVNYLRPHGRSRLRPGSRSSLSTSSSSSSSSSFPKVLLVSASQPRCGTDDGDSDIVKFLKNKGDYARKHDMATWFSLEVLVSATTRRARNKVMLLRHIMRTQTSYDWFFWLDSDTMIADLNFEVPWMDYENQGYSFVVWGDPTFLDRSPNYDQLNFGILLLRNDRYALQFLDSIVNFWDSNPNQTVLYDQVRSKVSSMPPYVSDQSTAIYLLTTQREIWQRRVFLENRFHFNRYWKDITHELEKYYEKPGAWVGDGKEPPFLVHFCGCALCFKKVAGDFDECQEQHDRTFRFANNQVIKELGYRHKNLSSDEMVSLKGKVMDGAEGARRWRR